VADCGMYGYTVGPVVCSSAGIGWLHYAQLQYDIMLINCHFCCWVLIMTHVRSAMSACCSMGLVSVSADSQWLPFELLSVGYKAETWMCCQLMCKTSALYKSFTYLLTLFAFSIAKTMYCDNRWFFTVHELVFFVFVLVF